ncbi:MAG TPA: MFS transporter [Terriglobales bacterium]|nr:MFS transporter [Terriglobales bacterium]
MQEILRNRAFVRAALTSFFFFTSQNGFVLLPLYIKQLGGTEVEIGLVMGISSAVGIVAQPLLGPWVDALGRRPFMLAGIACVSAATVVAAIGESVPAFLVVRVLQGLGFSAFFVANFSYVIDLIEPERRGMALGIYGVSGFASTALAPLIGEWLIRRWGFHALFAGSGLIVLAAAWLAWQVRETQRTEVRYVRGLRWAREAVTDVFRRHMAVAFFFGLGAGTLTTFMPTFAEDLGVRTVALFYTGYALSAIAVRLVGGTMIDTRGRRAVIVPSMFVLAASAALLAGIGYAAERVPALPVLPAIVVAGLLSGAAHGFLYPALAALVADGAPPVRRGAVIGIFSALFLCGQGGGAFAFGGLAHALGYVPMWLALTALVLVGSLVSLGLERPSPSAG